MFKRVLVIAVPVLCLSFSGIPATADGAVLPIKVTENLVLTAKGGPYTGSSVEIPAGIKVAAQPGAIVKLTGSLKVLGSLLVEGTASEPVFFTSFKDDSAGGDTNGDGSKTKPAGSDWGGIQFSSSGTGAIDHAVISYGGNPSDDAMLTIKSTCGIAPSITNSTLSKSKYSGIGSTGSCPSITKSTITENGERGIAISTGGAPQIHENTISHNNVGIAFSVAESNEGTVDIEDNLIESNAQNGVSIAAGTGKTKVASAGLGGNEVNENGGIAISYDVFANGTESKSFTGNPIPSDITTNTLSGNGKNGIWLGGAVTTSMTWEDRGYPIVIFGGGVNIVEAATLTLGAGLAVKNEQRNLYIHGVLKAKGTAEAPIVLTSYKDDSVEGDTNGDGATSPAPGDWLGLEFAAHGGEPRSASSLDHVQIRYGGQKVSPFAPAVAIKCPCKNAPAITNSVVSNSYNVAVQVTGGGSPIIIGNTITKSGSAGISVVEGGAPEIHENVVSENGLGIGFSLSSSSEGVVDIEDNVVERNEREGISVSASTSSTKLASAGLGGNEVNENGGIAISYEAFPNGTESKSFTGNPIPSDITTNTLSGNGKNGIWVAGAIKTSMIWEDLGYPLVIFGNGVNVMKGATLTMGAGLVIKNEKRSLYVHGTLIAEGTAETPIVLTSYKDDSVDGDTNGDGSTSPGPSDWESLEFAADGSEPRSASSLDHVQIRYGGQKISPFAPMISIKCPCKNPPVISDSVISHSYTDGIQIVGGSPSIYKSTIANNGEQGIRVSTGGAPEIHENVISENGEGISFGVATSNEGAVDIEDNVIEGNAKNGISISAATGSTKITSASLGGNEVNENGGTAISYDVFANSTESKSFTGNPIPSDITTNTLSGNGKNGIWVAGAVRTSATWKDPGYPLVIFGNGVNVVKGATLTLGAGLVAKGEGASLYVHGEIETTATLESPVTITSVKDDTIGGDTNGDGSATSPALADWGEFYVAEAIDVELSYMNLRYAEAALSIGKLSLLTISHSDFAYNYAAVAVDTTTESYPELAALPCVYPYLSSVFGADNWFSPVGLPSPSIDIASAVGTVIPEKYAPLFGAATSLAPTIAPLYGQENTIPFSIYSCPMIGIPPTAVTPVFWTESPLSPHFP